MARVHNFSAGPAALPASVLSEIAAELPDYRGCGMSVLEMSHRSAAYQHIFDEAEACLRRVLSIPDTYAVLFLQGGATLEFAAIPLNLMHTGRAGYVVSGHFAKKAWQEAAKYGDAALLASSEDTGFDRIPDLAPVEARCREERFDYVHICQNNTIFGTMYRELPDTGDIPLVADVSSCFLSFPLEVERYGLIYAGAQKNLGPSGLALVIIRRDLVSRTPEKVPTMLRYATYTENNSLYNTPPTFGIYMIGLVTDWIKEVGGLAELEKINDAKAALLYQAIDDSNGFYRTPVQKCSRSKMNVVFRLPTEELEAKFLDVVKTNGMIGLKGHRSVGGIRASIYNAMPMEGVEKLVSIMNEFRMNN